MAVDSTNRYDLFRMFSTVKIVVAHRYFWPDSPPYASILKDICARLAADGHDVTVLSTQPSYNLAAGIERRPHVEYVEGVRVLRLRLFAEDRRRTLVRIVNVFLFCTQVMLHLLRNRSYEAVMGSSFPPVAAAFTASLGAQLIGARFVYHMQDIYPEIAQASHLVRGGTLVRLMLRLDTMTLGRTAVAVVLSHDMATAIGHRAANTPKVQVVRNFNTFGDAVSTSVPVDLVKREGAFRVLFAGNLGRFQGLDSVIDSALLIRDDTVIVEFVGDGVARQDLERRAGSALGRSVLFHGHLPADVTQAVIRTADLALVTLTEGVIRYAFPTKLIAYLAAATPLVVAVEHDSELASTVSDRGIGIVVPPGDPRSLASAIEHMRLNPALRAEMSGSARRLYDEQFDRSRILSEWSDLFDELATR